MLQTHEFLGFQGTPTPRDCPALSGVVPGPDVDGVKDVEIPS